MKGTDQSEKRITSPLTRIGKAKTNAIANNLIIILDFSRESIKSQNVLMYS